MCCFDLFCTFVVYPFFKMFDVNFFKNQTVGPFRGRIIGKNCKILHKNKHDIHEDWVVGVEAGYFEITEMFKPFVFQTLSQIPPLNTLRSISTNFVT